MRPCDCMLQLDVTHWQRLLLTDKLIDWLIDWLTDWLTDRLTQWNRILLGFQNSRKRQYFMKCKNSSPLSQQLDVRSYSEPHQCISHLPWYFLTIHFHIVLHLSLGLPIDFFLQVFPPKLPMPFPSPYCYLLLPSHSRLVEHPNESCWVKSWKSLIFMVIPCINDIKRFLVQLMHM